MAKEIRYSHSLNGRTILVDFDNVRTVFNKTLKHSRNNSWWVVYHYWFEILDKEVPHYPIMFHSLSDWIAQEMEINKRNHSYCSEYNKLDDVANGLRKIYGSQTIFLTFHKTSWFLDNSGKDESEFLAWNEQYNSGDQIVFDMHQSMYYKSLDHRYMDILKLQNDYINETASLNFVVKS